MNRKKLKVIGWILAAEIVIIGILLFCLIFDDGSKGQINGEQSLENNEEVQFEDWGEIDWN